MRWLWSSITFALVSAGQNFRRNLAISLAGVFTIGLILVMVGGTLLGTHFVNGILQTEQQHAGKLKIYMASGASLASIENLEWVISQRKDVASAYLENKDQAAQQLSGDGTSITAVISAIGNNPLPDSINVTVRQLSSLKAINQLALSSPVVDTHSPTDYSKTVISRLEGIIFWIKAVGASIAVVLSFISLVIIMNTIRTAVFVRRTEIEIMKLVGATDWFVRWPFILEGVLGGLLAAIFAGAIIAGTYSLLAPHLTSGLLAGYGGNEGAYLVSLLLRLGGAGVLLGALGSYLGVRRFLTA